MFPLRLTDHTGRGGDPLWIYANMHSAEIRRNANMEQV